MTAVLPKCLVIVVVFVPPFSFAREARLMRVERRNLFHRTMSIDVQDVAHGHRRAHVAPSFARIGALPPDHQSHVWFFSHRSCSQNSSDPCNEHFQSDMRSAREIVHQAGVPPNHTFLYTALPDYLMSNASWQRHIEPFMRGRGYWFWKVAIWNHLLHQADLNIKDGDLFIYADGDPRDVSIVQTWIQEFGEDQTWDMIVLQQPEWGPPCEKYWTKGDIFKLFGVKPEDPHYGLTQQYRASRIALRINDNTRKFMTSWEQLVNDFHLVSDEHSISRDGDGFRENRHDQSMFSMLLKASLAHNGACGDPERRVPHQHPTASEELNILPSNSTGTLPWKPHEKFGIPGLRVKFDVDQ